MIQLRNIISLIIKSKIKNLRFLKSHQKFEIVIKLWQWLKLTKATWFFISFNHIGFNFSLSVFFLALIKLIQTNYENMLSSVKNIYPIDRNHYNWGWLGSSDNLLLIWTENKERTKIGVSTDFIFYLTQSAEWVRETQRKRYF